MPYVSVPKDMSKIKVKVLFGLTKRQIVCFGIAGLMGAPAFWFMRKSLGLGAEISMIVMIALMMPMFFLGMYAKDGLPAEKVARNILRSRLWPGVRPYRTENLFEWLEGKEGEKAKWQRQAKRNPPKKSGANRRPARSRANKARSTG